jgi:cytochrome c oxidase cbb3-type subunit I
VWLWLAPIAIGTIYYFVAKLSNRPLYSRTLAAFSFWFYLVFVHALGFQNMPGLPNWLPVLSSVMNLLLLIPLAVMRVNWYQTWAGHNRAKKQKESATRYIGFAILAFTLSLVLGYIVSLPGVDEVIGLTVFHHGMTAWVGYGFLGMALFGAMVHILPRLTEVEWPSPKLAGAHFTLTAVGIILVAGAWMLGGLIQGNAINNPSVEFNSTVRRLVPFIGVNSIGLLVLLVAQVALLANMVLMFKASVANCCGWGRKEAVR